MSGIDKPSQQPTLDEPHETVPGDDFLQFLDNINCINDRIDPVDLDALIGPPPDDEINALLEVINTPLNATLISAQRSKGPQRRRKAAKPAPQPHPPAPPIAKPQKKLRDKDRLDLLEKHLEAVADQVQRLSLRNTALNKRTQVLEHMVGTIAHCEALAQQAQLDIAHHKAHPDQPPRGAALYQTWTRQQYISFFNSQNALGSRWMLELDAAQRAGQPLPAKALEQLAANHRHVLEVTFHVSQGEGGSFIPHVMADMLQMFPANMDEDAHWDQVLEAMQVTEEQAEDVIMAREVFFTIINRLADQKETFKAVIHQGTQQVGQATTIDSVLILEEQLLAQIEANLRKNMSLVMLLAMSVFLSTLNPFQVAKCALHAHPLFPDAVLVINRIHDKFRATPSNGPQLGPEVLPGLASATTLRAALQLFPPSAAAPPVPDHPPPTPANPPAAAALPSDPGHASSVWPTPSGPAEADTHSELLPPPSPPPSAPRRV